MAPSPPAVIRRRLLAVAATIAATLAVWLLLFGEDDSTRQAEREAERVELSGAASRILAELTRLEKVDQVMLIGIAGTSPSEELVRLLASRQPGGILIGRSNWTDAAQGSALIAQLRGLDRRPGNQGGPLIVAAQEGGTYRSFDDLPPAERQIEIGDFAQPARAERWSQGTAAALAGVGFDLNLGPIADVATIDSPIADRAFSDDPRIAAAMTAAAVRGCRRGGIACAPAHFPGLGAASQDTDSGPATVSLDPTSLEQRDLSAFEAGFEAGARAVVVGHALYAAYDPVTPASLSPEVIDGLLRDQLGFEGVAITDDLGAGAIEAGYRTPRAAVLAIQAGADLVMISDPAQREGVAAALSKAIASGQIAPERIDAAAGRVIELKLELGVIGER